MSPLLLSLPIKSPSQVIRQLLERTNDTLAIHNLDAVVPLEKFFSKNLPATESEAQVEVHQRMNRYGEQQFETDIIQACQCLLLTALFMESTIIP